MVKDFKYIVLIITIFIAACIETDIYLPAFTDMMSYFSISEEEIQGLLTWNFVAICLSGPFYGPLSDALGRKKPLLFALGIFLLGSVLTVVADNFNMMLLGRILQGVGSGGCFVLGTAIIFDVFEGEKAIHALNRINSIVPFIMAAAPLLGGYLNLEYGFRSNFLTIAFFVLTSFLITAFFLKEPLEKTKRTSFDFPQICMKFKEVALSIPFWQTIVIVSLIFSGYLAFLSSISILFVLELGVAKANLPYFQAALLAAWLIANLFFKKLVNLSSLHSVKIAGTFLFCAGGVITIGSAFLFPTNPYGVTLGMVLYALGANWVQGIYFPEGMALFPESKGITASFLTSARLMIAAGVVGLASHYYDATIFPIAYTIAAVVCVVFVTILFYERRRKELISHIPSDIYNNSFQ